ncbi:SURF1 family protein [Roseovarius faecimaris]|uniref:SURF1-like protein n=1 Tax=Roseovarius faecimaris TaxID=2494550 RepID=A0A6I6ILV6_9RHOB|nr:SURF1 family protein [Roseovarius faecimaris]QGX97555.1 SURF1 family protein [Roseovarius faecimaris]
MRRLLIPVMFGLLGVGVLLWLGTWQVQRLAWKEGVLAEIEARIAAAPVALPANPDPERDQYLSVRLSGTLSPETLRVLVSRKQIGAGYRLISALDTGERRVLVDRGFVRVGENIPDAPTSEFTVTGNLNWPDDRNSSTPDNDVAGNTWFARDIAQMAEVLDTQPVLVIAREMSPADPGVTSLPVDTSAIPNDHLSYAITWYSLAAIWAIMTLYFLWRQRAPRPKAR